MSYPTDNTALPVYAGTALQGDIDHAGWHGDTNADLDGVKTVLGITAGTSVLKDVALGDFVSTLAGTETLINKTLTSPILQGTVDGWILANESWAYASATTITVPSGAATKYAKGDKIKITQTTAKYFYVVGVADTVLTVTGGSDYTVANAAIASPYYSHASSPIGFPDFFNFAATFTGFSSDPADNTFIFKIVGKFCHYKWTMDTDGTSNATTFTITVPIASVNVAHLQYFNPAVVRDNGANVAIGIAFLSSNDSTISFYQSAFGAFTNSGGKRAQGGMIVYRYA